MNLQKTRFTLLLVLFSFGVIAIGTAASLQKSDPAVGENASMVPSLTPLSKATIIEPPDKEPAGDSIAINFEGVDLLSLLRYLSTETGKGFIVDENVKGSITIISPVKLTRKEALATLESILQVKGFAAIPSGKMYKIVPMAQAKVAGTETRKGSEVGELGDDDTLVTQIIPLEKTSVDEAKTILTPLLPQDASILTFSPSNTLIITGRSVNIKRAMEVLGELEKGRLKPGLDIVPLEYTTAGYVKSQLDQIMQGSGVGRGEIRGGVYIIPDSRINSLLVITSPENFAVIRSLVNRLDTASSDTRPELSRFFILKYADEAETVKQIQDILSLGRKSGDGIASESQAVESTKIIPIKRTRSIMVITRSAELLQKIADLLKHLDQRPPQETSNVKIVRVVNADAKILAETLSKLAQDKAKGKQNQKVDNINFAADSHTNSLIITGQSQLFAQYEPIIHALDIMRPQILVEALIVEVSGSLSKSMGIEWSILDAGKTGWRAIGGTNFDLKSTMTSAQGMQIGLLKETFDLQKAQDGDIVELSKIKALASLYQNNSDFNILSAPQILTTDNEEAKIMVGEIVALPQGFTKDSNTGRFDLTNFKYEDVGINLVITPRVNSDQIVTLKLDQEVKKRQEENLYQFNVPVLTKRKMTTTITVPNHETIVIGGLMREDRTVVEDRIPLFSNLPLIGKAFRNKRTSLQKTNLLVFLTPHVLSTPEQVAAFDVTKLRNDMPASNTMILNKVNENPRVTNLRNRAGSYFDAMRIKSQAITENKGRRHSENPVKLEEALAVEEEK